MYYKSETGFVKASNVVYLERKLVEYFLSNYHQGWMSQESQAEAYNETWRDSTQVELVKKFLEDNPTVGAQFNKKMKPEDLDFLSDHLDEEDIELETNTTDERLRNSSFCGMFEIHRKNLSQAYFNLWVPEELRERNMLWSLLYR